MKNFKEMLDRDLDTTFYSTGEFARVKRVRYDGTVRDIPVIFDSEKTKGRNGTGTDNAEGLHGKFTAVRVRLADLGEVPRQGARFRIGEELYTITDILDEYGELAMTLERFDE